MVAPWGSEAPSLQRGWLRPALRVLGLRKVAAHHGKAGPRACSCHPVSSDAARLAGHTMELLSPTFCKSCNRDRS